MKKITIVVLLVLIASLTKAQFTVSTPYVVPNTDWIEYFSSRDNIANAPTTIDANGSMFITGYTGSSPTTCNILTQKRDSTGALVYTSIYNNGSYDKGNAIKIHGSNAFVAGVSFDAATNNDYIILKYGSTGSQIWAYRFDLASDEDEAVDIKVDASGNSYVTGKAKNSSGNFDIVTLKLNSSGALVWSHTFDGAANMDDIASGIVIIGSSVYVTGSTTDPVTGTDIIIYQLSASSGTLGWSSTLNGTASGNDKTNGTTISGADILICGEMDNSGTGLDAFFARIDGASGTTVFKHSYDFSGAANRATSLVRDSTGNVAVVGLALNSSVYEYHTSFYDSTGTQIWVNTESTNLTSVSVEPRIACDTIAHHFYVSGEKMVGSKDIFAYQVTPTGTTSWRKTYDGHDNADLDAAIGIAVNGVGVVYLAALSETATGVYDYTSIKINQTPVYFPDDLGSAELPHSEFTFEENRGQLIHTDGAVVSATTVAFFNQATSPSHYFSNTKISHILINSNPSLDGLPDSLERVDMSFLGANPLSEFSYYNPIEYKKNYFVGSSPTGISEVNNYERLFIPNLYAYTDVHYYSNTSGLKTYFVFKQSERVNVPQFEIAGALSTTITGDGYLMATTNLGEINMGKLTAYQPTFNIATLSYTLVPVSVGWTNVSGDTYKFGVGSFNGNLPLVVYISKPGATAAAPAPPINNIYWSTFIGGQGNENILGSVADAKDNYYICGYTTALDYPYVAGSFQNAPASTAAGIASGVLTKFDKDRRKEFSTYFRPKGNLFSACGPTGDTRIYDVAIDSLYNVYAVGQTRSNTMPIKAVTLTAGLSQTVNAALVANNHCFNSYIVKLNPKGKDLHFASYYGGDYAENLRVIKYQNDNLWMGGSSLSSTLNLIQSAPGSFFSTVGDGFYMRIDTQGVIKHSTKLANSVKGGAVDNNGNWYTVANTSGTFGVNVLAPAAGFYTANIASTIDWTLQRFTGGDVVDWSTYIGGTSNDYVENMTIRDSVMVICGYGTSNNFPFFKSSSDSGDVNTSNADEVQLIKFNINNGQRLWCAYHTTFNSEQAFDVALDKDYNLYVTGLVKCALTSNITSCPGNSFKLTPNSYYYHQNDKIAWDGFILGYSHNNLRKWTTYLGSVNVSAFNANDEWGQALEATSMGNLFVTGFTRSKSNSFPLVRLNNVCHYDSAVADPTTPNSADGYVTMFDISNFQFVGLEEQSVIEVSDNVRLFPNPNNGIFTVRINETPKARIFMEITNVLGQAIYKSNATAYNEGDYEINAGNLVKGVYFLTVTEGTKQRTLKFIVH